MRTLLLASVILALTAPTASAEGSDDCVDVDQCIYLEATGHLVVGLLDVGVEPVNQAAFVVAPVEGYHMLRLKFDFTPDGVAFDTPAAEGKLSYQFRVRIHDNATDELLSENTLRGSGNIQYAAPNQSPVRIELTMLQGADVTYALRVSALRDHVIIE